MLSYHGKICFLLSLAIIFNVTFTLLFYLYLEDDVPDRPGVLIPLVYDKNSDMDKVEFEFSNSPSIVDDHSNTTTIWLAGIILDTMKIQPHIWDSVILLNCKYNIGIHIITKDNVAKGEKKRDELYKKYHPFEHANCAPFMIMDQNNSSFTHGDKIESEEKNRIDRISKLRDYQRKFLQEKALKYNLDDGVIILTDLDLYELPSIELIYNQTQEMKSTSYQYDAVCAIGTTVNFGETTGNQRRKVVPFYYDTYATVFLPDTFSHPLSRRLITHYYQGEDPQMVRSNDQVNGNFTQFDIWKYFAKEGKKLKTGKVPVKSCFGGMTIYKSSVYFNRDCEYTLSKEIIEEQRNNQTSIMRYADNKEQRPCEHVVLHNCLSNKIPTFKVAVNSDLMTIWRRDV